MKHFIQIITLGLTLLIAITYSNYKKSASAYTIKKDSKSGSQNFKFSNLRVKITSNGQVAIFKLYDTTAAEEFYAQLPLNLELSNFRDAQWMFYPPVRLNVKPDEAYHDGKKGELSYYKPWGDVFMLYKDFHAGDEMHRLGVGISGVDSIEKMSGTAFIEKSKQ